MILFEMESADKDKIKNCEFLGGLKNECHFLSLVLTYDTVHCWNEVPPVKIGEICARAYF